VEALELEGKTTLLLGIDGCLGLILTLQEEHLAKPEALGVVNYLQHTLNMRVCMITGDNAHTARKVAEYLGIEQKNVRAEAYPKDKKKAVEGW